MTDRDKEIEEMMKDLKCAVMEGGECRKSISCEECVARMLVDACYRKIPKDAVVLAKEEYEDMQARMAYLQEELGKLLRGDNVSVSVREYGQLLYAKENAQKEIDKAVEERTIAIIRDLIGHRFAYYLKDETYGTVTCCADYVVDADDVKFLEEKYKVKVGK